MRQFINPSPNGGRPAFSDDLDNIYQDDIYTTFAALLAGMGASPCIISGLVVSSLDTIAHTYNLSAGYVLLDGHIIKFNAYSGSYRVPSFPLISYVLIEGTPSITTDIFKDGSPQNSIIENTTTLVDVIPLGHDGINMEPSSLDSYRLLNRINAPVNAGLATTNANVTALQTNKADVTQPAWIIPGSLTSSWANTGGGKLPFQYRQNTLNKVQVRGVIRGGADVSSPFTFLSPLVPTKEFWTVATYGNNSSGGAMLVRVSAAGTVTLTDLTGGYTTSQDVAIDFEFDID